VAHRRADDKAGADGRQVNLGTALPAARVDLGIGVVEAADEALVEQLPLAALGRRADGDGRPKLKISGARGAGASIRRVKVEVSSSYPQ
jgi:hypothetical protein